MFRVWQTRLVFVFMILITFLICTIGLLLRRRAEYPGKVVQKLDIPEVPELYTEMPRGISEKDEGKTIILD